MVVEFTTLMAMTAARCAGFLEISSNCDILKRIGEKAGAGQQ